ncbi:MAG: hypothetical protein LBQ32_06130, partial [Burkholderiaceae bacterium]|nr:hypothetical protein [Burkholderiaceae bacterium]
MAPAMSALCAWIGHVLTTCSGAPDLFTASDTAPIKSGVTARHAATISPLPSQRAIFVHGTFRVHD